jgi:hypothetical protein
MKIASGIGGSSSVVFTFFNTGIRDGLFNFRGLTSVRGWNAAGIT